MRVFFLAAFLSVSAATFATHVRLVVKKPIVARRPTKFKRWSDVDLYAAGPSVSLDSYGVPLRSPDISYGGFRPVAPSYAPAVAPAIDAASPWASFLNPDVGTFDPFAPKPLPVEPSPAPTEAPLPVTTTAAPTPATTKAPAAATTPATALPTGEPIAVSKIAETITIGLAHPLTLDHLRLHPSQIDLSQLGFNGAQDPQVFNQQWV
ncbi:Hypothetical predicted protein [Cloeon dipterum]|uniref:Uncharacterized protein n=1 Tax=Cloeon dipterum TaxID=197152 RepID=A0A8S1DUY8_9INSE|nr:Hypothetical predicted protein [Cloeon dipterum]